MSDGPVTRSHQKNKMKTTVYTQIAVDTNGTKRIAKLHGSCEIEIGDESLGYTVHDIIDTDHVRASVDSEELHKLEADKDVTAIHYYYRTNRRDAWHSPEVA